MLTRPPATYEAWVDHLAACELPVLQYTLTRLGELKNRLDEISLRDLTRLARRDALMTLRVIRFLQQRRHLSQTTDVNTVGRALLMIGMQGFIQEFGKATPVEQILKDTPQAVIGIRRMLARAGLAARFAESIAAARHDVDPEEVITAALLHDAVEILLWLLAPTLAMQIEQLLADEPGLRSREAQRRVLGHSLFELQLALVQRWQLPTLLAHLMDERYQSEPRVRTVMVSAALSRHLLRGWDDAGLPDDFSEVAELIGIEPDAAYALVRDVAVTAAHDWHWYDTLPLLARLPDTR
ncbi:HDOD domain-containing protein [Chitiniphilus purpureus]|uniref:HDOD domain-containing protein n=1 Tax=Chitiniphilus purpureus TaxID=2981137 RepID=A0ABY6DS87_9NEIS|nr:HDOD domain-containing protein [Chitiniphilus sp. CD1]UXY16583.1 HDOD domain-containing protein [Chitiniphilus sp. CD1]